MPVVSNFLHRNGEYYICGVTTVRSGNVCGRPCSFSTITTRGIMYTCGYHHVGFNEYGEPISNRRRGINRRVPYPTDFNHAVGSVGRRIPHPPPNPPDPIPISFEPTETVSTDGDLCVICISDIVRDSLQLRCGHKFHATCINTWFDEVNTIVSKYVTSNTC
jgi:hypothetical protein